jgi:16S rRNA C967 or C1407 C5-methylase (RsmB/RsmF family)/NOL1/NOP2/fmu family ribosome biogenesis protein
LSTLPTALIRSLENVKGFNEEAFKAVHQPGEQIVSIRFNPSKAGQRTTNLSTVTSAKPDYGQLEKVPWNSNGYYLNERPSFTLDPLFHAGAYYVQEASSMFLEEALKQTVGLTKSIKILDLCAAPGGKSTLIQSIITNDSLLVSNELIKNRENNLSENMNKLRAANVIVTNNDPKDFQRLQNYFDVIVVDAPCSGSGLFRKDTDAINEWSEHNVALCAQRQQRILADVLPSLKEGGVIMYSTCSYSKEEDEAVADWLVEQFNVESLQLKPKEAWGIVETISEKQHAFGYRFYPDKVKGEGFFISAFKKRVAAVGGNNESKNQQSKSKKKTATIPVKDIEILKPYLMDAANFFFIKQNDDVIAMPMQLENELEIIQSALYIKKAGIRLGAIIRNELIPAHDLAVSTIINPLVTRLEVGQETALQYLRKAEIKIESDIKGWVLLTYAQLPMGWIKLMLNRVNNYYPKAWRILNK